MTAEGTGQIVRIPNDFVWSRLKPSDLFATGASTATWEGGIACADTHGVVTDYWNTEVVFTANTTDPGGFTWAVARPLAAKTNFPWRALFLIGTAVIISGAALSLRRRASKERT
jgi:hypothetical protein